MIWLTWQVNLVRPDQKPGCNPLTFVFCFYQNDVVLIFFKKINLTNQVIRSKPRTQTLDRTGHQAGSENYAIILYKYIDTRPLIG